MSNDSTSNITTNPLRMYNMCRDQLQRDIRLKLLDMMSDMCAMFYMHTKNYPASTLAVHNRQEMIPVYMPDRLSPSHGAADDLGWNSIGQRETLGEGFILMMEEMELCAQIVQGRGRPRVWQLTDEGLAMALCHPAVLAYRSVHATTRSDRSIEQINGKLDKHADSLDVCHERMRETDDELEELREDQLAIDDRVLGIEHEDAEFARERTELTKAIAVIMDTLPMIGSLMGDPDEVMPEDWYTIKGAVDGQVAKYSNKEEK